MQGLCRPEPREPEDACQKLTASQGFLAILALSDACQIVVARSKDLPGAVMKPSGERHPNWGEGRRRQTWLKAAGFLRIRSNHG